MIPVRLLPSHRRAHLVAGAILVLGGAFLAAGATTPAASAPTSFAPVSATQDRVIVDLVVDFGDGRAEVAHLDVVSGTTALQALASSGLEVVTYDAGFGNAVCAIGGVGCPASDCFCACPGEDCRFWGLQIGDIDGGWTPAEVGAGDFIPSAGENVIGFIWGLPAPLDYSPNRLTALSAWRWLRPQLQEDGGLHDAGLTLEGVFAARAAHADVERWRAGAGGPSPLEALQTGAAEYAARSAGATGKLMAGLAALHHGTTVSGQAIDLTAFGGVPVMHRVFDNLDPNTGRYGESTWDQGWSILGLALAGAKAPDVAIAALNNGSAPSGGWGDHLGSSTATVDATGLALSALGAAGYVGTPVTEAALDWLFTTLNDDGGWGTGPDATSNVNSTAYALYGLWSQGEVPTNGRWVSGGAGPLDYLRGTQDRAGFLVHSAGASELVATLQAIPALVGLAPATRGANVARARAAATLHNQRLEDGSFGAGEGGQTVDARVSTAAAVVALVAAGIDPDGEWHEALPSALAYLLSESAGSNWAMDGAAEAAWLVAALAALGEDPRAAGDIDAVALLEAHFHASSGRYGLTGSIEKQSLAMLAMAAAEQTIPASAIEWLRTQANEDGGWGTAAGMPTAVGATGMALAALDAAGVPDDAPTVRAGVAALRQLRDGHAGFVGPEGAATAEDIGWAIFGLVAAGQDVDGPGWAAPMGDGRWRGPRDALVSLQADDGGYGATDATDTVATAAGLRGLVARAALPPPERAGGSVWLPALLRDR
jgi:prenyltransferase beta subunit